MLVDSIISKNLNKFEKEVKNFKHVAKFVTLVKAKTNLEVAHCKVNVRLHFEK